MKLVPPRPDFSRTLSDAERALMQQHLAYCQQMFAKGQLLAFGPVMDPEGDWGMGLLAAESVAAAEGLMADDPTVKAGLNRALVVPMFLAAIQPERVTQ